MGGAWVWIVPQIRQRFQLKLNWRQQSEPMLEMHRHLSRIIVNGPSFRAACGLHAQPVQ